MKRTMIVGAALALGLAAGSPAFAVGGTTSLHVPPQTSVDVREWVVKNKPKPYRFKEPVIIGGTVPDNVDVVAVPDAWGDDLRSYHYVYADDHVYLVDPSSRKVIYIIE